MKLLAGIILASCLGVPDLASAALAPDVSSPGSSLGLVAPLPPSRLLRPHVPPGPGAPAGSDAVVIDFDRESEPDDEAHLILIGGLDRGWIPFPHWLTTPAALPRADSAPLPIRLPRCFPIRC